MAFTVTATQSGSSSSAGAVFLLVQVLTGATAAGGSSAAGASGSGAAAQGSVNPAGTNSLIVYALSVDGVTAPAAAASNTYYDKPDNTTFTWGAAHGHYSGTVTSGTPVTAGAGSAAGDHSNWAIYEILASGGSTPAVDASSPAFAPGTDTATAATTASFTPPAGSVLAAMIIAGGSATGTGITMTVTDTSGLGLVWTQRAVSSASDSFQPAWVYTTTIPAAASPAGAGSAQPGRTWLRRFHHRQRLSQPGAAAAAAAAVPAPLMRPAILSRPAQRARVGARGMCAAGVAVVLAASAAPPGIHPQPAPAARRVPARAHTGPQGRPGSGIASAIVTPLGQAARPQPFVFRSPPPRRARTGPAGLPGDGIASAIVTPLGSPPVPPWRPFTARRVPDRAQLGPSGRNAGGIASQTVTPRGTPGPSWRPQPRRPAPARGLWRAIAGPQPPAVTTVTAYQHAPPPPRSPAPRRVLWRGYGSPVVTPLGTPTARRPVFIAPGRRSRAAIGHGQVAGGIAGPQAVAPIAPQAYQHPPRQPRSSAPRRALWRGLAVPAPRPAPGPAWRPLPRSPAPRRALWHGGTGPQPVTAAAPAAPRQPRQPRPAPPRRALWHGLASRIVTPLGIPSRKPPPPANTPRKRQRGLWRRGAGPQPPPPSGLLAGVTAGPPASRWQATSLPASRWQPRPPASRWQATSLPASRYDAGNPASRWQAGPPVKGRYSMRIVTGSVEYVQFPIAGPPGVDVTTFPVEVAVVTEAHGEPPPGDPAWTAGSWLGGLASLLVDETVLGNGDYVVFGRLTASPEKPVVRAGRVRLGPAS